jgi:hypothetical protein
VLEASDPQQLNAYGYGASNPVTFADPTGERVVDDDRVSGAVGGFGWGIARLIARDVKLMARAIAARNAEAMAGTAAKGKTYTGSHNRLTGKVAGAMSGHGGCVPSRTPAEGPVSPSAIPTPGSAARHTRSTSSTEMRGKSSPPERSRKTVVAQGRSLWSRRMSVTGARPAASGFSTKMRRRAVVGRPEHVVEGGALSEVRREVGRPGAHSGGRGLRHLRRGDRAAAGPGTDGDD